MTQNNFAQPNQSDPERHDPDQMKWGSPASGHATSRSACVVSEWNGLAGTSAHGNLFVTSTGTTSTSDLTAAVSGRKERVLCVPVRAWVRTWGEGTDGVSAPAGLGILANGDVGVAEPPRGPQPVAGPQQGGV